MDTQSTPTEQSTQPMTRKERREMKRQQQKSNQSSTQRNKTLRTWGIWLGIIAIVGVGIWGLVASQPDTSSIVAAGTNEITDHDRVKGDKAAKALLIEYSDFQCPACATYEPMLEQAVAEYGERVAFVYRHFPLRQIHPNAQLAAQAAEAAGMQSKFWEMHDKLFDTQTAWSSLSNPRDTFKTYAESLELNVETFMTDLDSETTKSAVEADYQSGVKANVQGTPTFYLNGAKKSFRSYDDLKKALDAVLL